MGRFLPFSEALRQRAVMLQCMRQETANYRHPRLFGMYRKADAEHRSTLLVSKRKSIRCFLDLSFVVIETGIF
jgi:hypothetical protein